MWAFRTSSHFVINVNGVEWFECSGLRQLQLYWWREHKYEWRKHCGTGSVLSLRAIRGELLSSFSFSSSAWSLSLYVESFMSPQCSGENKCLSHHIIKVIVPKSSPLIPVIPFLYLSSLACLNALVLAQPNLSRTRSVPPLPFPYTQSNTTCSLMIISPTVTVTFLKLHY